METIYYSDIIEKRFKIKKDDKGKEVCVYEDQVNYSKDEMADLMKKNYTKKELQDIHELKLQFGGSIIN